VPKEKSIYLSTDKMKWFVERGVPSISGKELISKISAGYLWIKM
jgi:hypothetical protein